MLKQLIEDDLKSAMLSGNSDVTEALKMLKAAILNKEVELGVRDSGLSDDQVIDLLSKEAKKRLESSTVYANAGREDQANGEKAEYELIQKYLPEQMSEQDLKVLVSQTIGDMGQVTIKDMGRVIGAVKSKAGASADGGKIAELVKQQLS
ncbi:GatB/YqeY domain-containing protein [Candidatus Nomurabacteria bacterium]|nr:GatB/YqeY domain-containing protein [Candidatus Nomurabacteria bacterium]